MGLHFVLSDGDTENYGNQGISEIIGDSVNLQGASPLNDFDIDKIILNDDGLACTEDELRTLYEELGASLEENKENEQPAQQQQQQQQPSQQKQPAKQQQQQLAQQQQQPTQQQHEEILEQPIVIDLTKHKVPQQQQQQQKKKKPIIIQQKQYFSQLEQNHAPILPKPTIIPFFYMLNSVDALHLTKELQNTLLEVQQQNKDILKELRNHTNQFESLISIMRDQPDRGPKRKALEPVTNNKRTKKSTIDNKNLNEKIMRELKIISNNISNTKNKENSAKPKKNVK